LRKKIKDIAIYLKDISRIISRNKNEVAAASTCTSWTSCAVPGGMAWGKIKSEIEYGTMVAYILRSEATPNEDGEYNEHLEPIHDRRLQFGSAYTGAAVSKATPHSARNSQNVRNESVWHAPFASTDGTPRPNH
jgi:hypothetical protein